MGYSDETLVDMYKNGDKDAIEELFERYKNLVRKKAKAMYLAGCLLYTSPSPRD